MCTKSESTGKEQPSPQQQGQTMETEFETPDIDSKISEIFESYHRVKPEFSSSWVTLGTPPNVKQVKRYTVGETLVTLYKIPGSTECFYHLTPFEYTLPDPQKKIISMAKDEILEHYPGEELSSQAHYAREFAKEQGNKLIYKYATVENVSLGQTRSEEFARRRMLSNILSRYTVGLGVIETMLNDPRMQDVYIDAPVGESPVYGVISTTDVDADIPEQCITNVELTKSGADSIVSRLQYESGRAFSEARPVLEGSLEDYMSRVTIIGQPLSPDGVSITFRRHSPEPWSLLRLIHVESLPPVAAGLLSFLIDGNATILVAGPRSAGKTSLLGSLMYEFPQGQRVVTIEDTLELPISHLQESGYKVQSMHVRSSVGGLGEMTAEESLRVSLRLGESAIIMGEVRGAEAQTLYEAMRAGTAGSAVAGTIHADSPKAVYERVVFDLDIPPKSFAATDVVCMMSYMRPQGLHRLVRKTAQISEVNKEEIPSSVESGLGGAGEFFFNDLMTFSHEDLLLRRTDYFGPKSEIISEIAEEWDMEPEEAVKDILARGRIRKTVVDRAHAENRMELIKAEWVPYYNDKFWELQQAQADEFGSVNYKKLVNDWESWFMENI